MSLFRFTCAGLLLAAALPAAQANDSQAEIGLGGLTLTKSGEIRLEQQELFISREEVRVSYRFNNTSGAPIRTLVAFPLPDIVPSPLAPVPDYLRDLNFSSTLNGAPLSLSIVQQAFAGGQEITARLNGLRIPLVPLPEVFDAAINALPPQTRAALAKEGLIEESGSDGKQTLWEAKWTIRTAVTREQVFPVGISQVEHRYKPFAGGSVGGGLDRTYRNTADFREKRRRHCIEDSFIAGLDRRLSTPGLRYSEVWLGYLLRPGANWAGPIGSFRLVVDKGNADSLVSFCAHGVRKLDATRFEVRYGDFTPKQDLSILIVDFHRD
jgi:Domain of unknown function (DUF4424)